MPNLLISALWYAAKGWAVFPLTPNSKVPRKGSAGCSDATTDQDRIRGWWAEEPHSNIGIATGPSNLAVIDVDVKSDGLGMETWRDILEEHGREIEQTAVSETPSGGLHFVYSRGHRNIRNSAGKLGPGLDIRGIGGYIVAPPSVLPNGEYVWAMERGPRTSVILPFPNSLAKLLGAPKTGDNGHTGTAKFSAGQRNDGLAREAGKLRSQGLSESVIEAALQAINQERCDPPLAREEVSKVASSIARYEPSEREHHLTDSGNAERLVSAHGENIRYCELWAQWLVWDGNRWARDYGSLIHAKAKQTIQQMYLSAGRIGDEERRTKEVKWALASESESRIRAMIALARYEPGVPIHPDLLDEHHWLLNCANGTLDLQSGELGDPRREDLLTKLMPTAYKPEASAPIWDYFQDHISGNTDELIGFKQRAFGYGLTGDTSEQCFFIHYGTGSNGKSTELNTVRAVLGADYAMHTPTDTVLIKRSDAIPNDLARLRGSRFVTAIEAEAGRRMAESLVKQMTGGDPIAARFMRAEWFEFVPTHKLYLAVNHKPVIRGADEAIWRRIRLIPYDVTIPPDEQDKHLQEKMEAEAEGVLAWLVRGCMEWQERGLDAPRAVTHATDEYRKDMDTLGDFLTECCVIGTRFETTAKNLHDAYRTWCEANGDKPLSKRALGMRLLERGMTQGRGSRGVRLWTSIGLSIV